LDKTSKDDAQRLRTTLNTTTEISSLTVAVLGCGRKDAEEVEMLRHLTDMDARVEVGASVLGVHLEERIHLQLETQYPKAIEKLLASLTETTARLDEVSEQSPSEVLYQMVLQVQQTFDLEKPKLMNELREVLADMTMQIKNYMVQVHKQQNILSRIDDFDDPLER
jgi:glutamyl/glutaminyl-tRNA synthetase